MKPGASFDRTTVLPSFSDSATVSVSVASEVETPRTISTSYIRGTGFVKCMPVFVTASLVL